MSSADAGAQRKRLVAQYVDTFREIEAAKPVEAQRALKDLSTSIASAVVSDKQPALNKLIDDQRAKLS